MATYTIESGDNLSSIASKLGISLEELKQANPAILPPAYTIRAGDDLALPPGAKNTVQNNSSSNSNGKSQDNKAATQNSKANSANDAAKANFNNKTGVTTQCPNQKKWITVVPLRYGVQQKNSFSFFPQKLKISGLKSLSKHIYVPRPLMPGYVYLYSQKEGYLLEAEYGESSTPKAASCPAGKAPGEVSSGFPNLQARKDDTIELLYTPCKLTPALVTAFQTDSKLRKKYFKTFSVTAARGKGTANASPLCELKNYLTDSNVKTEQFDWSIQSIFSGATDSLLAAANAATPDNHITVVLPDPITITTELALLFDAQYDVAMTSIAKTEHPYQVALVTQQLVNKKGAKAYSRHVSKVQSVSYYGGMVKRRTDDEVEHIRLARKYDAEKDLTEHLNYKQMQDFVKTRDDYTKNLAKTLDKEAEDWLKWLKSPELNQSLSFFITSPTPNLENLIKLEASLSNMTMNLQVSDKGAKLRNDWVDKHVINLSPNQEIASSDNSGWYVLLALTGKLATEANKVNKELIGASGIDYANMAKSYSDFIIGQNFKASLATDNLNAVFGERLAQLGIHMKAEAAFLFYIERQSYRYQYSLRTTEMKMGDMINDIQINHQANVQKAVGTAPTAIATSIRNSALIKTFDLAEPAPAGKIEKALTPFAKWFVSQADNAGLVKSDAIAVKTVQSAGDAFKPYAGKGLGLLFVGQVYNLFSITQKLSSGKSTNKDIVDLFSALAGITQTSFALLQRGMFKGSEAAFKAASKTMLENVGVTVNNVIKQLKYTNIENIEKTVKTKVLTSSDGMLVKFGRAGYKMLPVVGNLIAVISSGFNIHSDFSKDESLLTKTVGIASGVANTLAFGCAIVALVSPAAPLVAVAGIVLAVAGIILDIWHSYLQAEELERFLKGSLWGKSDNYEYQKGLSDTGRRLAYFESLTDAEVQKTIEKELTAFCHQLYKPVLTTENYFETHNGRYENFKLNIHLPGFNPRSGTLPYFKLTAKHYGKLTPLYESGITSLIQAEQNISNTEGKQAIFTLTLNLDETQRKMDFDDYQLELKHHHPAGFPVTLHYKIAIDDDSKIPLLTPDVSFDLKRVV